MTPRVRRRLALVGAIVLGIGGATALSLNALRDTLVFFFGPAELLARAGEFAGRPTRLGGLVVPGSIERSGTTVRFRVTDETASLPVAYTGQLPDLFREGQGVVAEGRLGADGVFAARTVLAKHDENYLPREVAETLERQGHLRRPSETPTAQ